MRNSDKEALRWYLQAAEKILKAFLYLRGENPVLDACRDLDVFYVPTRYPNGIPDGAPFEYFRLQHAEKACRAFDEVHAAAATDRIQSPICCRTAGARVCSIWPYSVTRPVAAV